MKEIIIYYVVIIVGGTIAIDMFGFMAWVLSGQTPPHDFYIGVLTTNVLRAIMGL